MAGESQAVAGGELCCGWGSARLWAEVGWQGCQGVPGCQGVDFPLRRAGRGWGGLAGAGAGWQGLAGAGVSKPRHPTVPPQTPPRSIVASLHCCKASLVPHAEAPLGSADYWRFLGLSQHSGELITIFRSF